MKGMEVSTEELRRRAAELDLRELVCPSCGGTRFTVIVDSGFDVVIDHGKTTVVRPRDCVSESFYLSCAASSGCSWGKSGGCSWGDSDDILGDEMRHALDSSVCSAVTDALKPVFDKKGTE